jgi:hypothetical protein
VSEAQVQLWFVQLLQHLKEVYSLPLSIHDTSTSGLTMPYAKIDITITPATIVVPTWSDVVSLFELKASLHNKTDYETAVGQVLERCFNIFRCQRKRPYVVAAVVGAQHINILRISRGYHIEHTDLLQLSLTPDNPGIQWLVRMLLSCSLFYKPPLLPSDFTSLKGNSYSRFQLLHSHHSSSAHGMVSPRGSEVYACSLMPNVSQDYIIKFNGELDARNEAQILFRLNQLRCPHIPFLMDWGDSGLPSPQFHHYLVVTPRGDHLRQNDSPSLICSVLADVCDAMLFAYHQADNLLHRDLSAGNVVHYHGQGFLIDWHVAAKQASSSSDGVITGTLMFTSPYLAHSRPHTLLDDLISLFFVLLFIVTGERLPWKHCLFHPRTVYDSKIALLTDDHSFQNALKGCSEQMKSVLQQVRSRLTLPQHQTPDKHVQLVCQDLRSYPTNMDDEMKTFVASSV